MKIRINKNNAPNRQDQKALLSKLGLTDNLCGMCLHGFGEGTEFFVDRNVTLGRSWQILGECFAHYGKAATRELLAEYALMWCQWDTLSEFDVLEYMNYEEDTKYGDYIYWIKTWFNIQTDRNQELLEYLLRKVFCWSGRVVGKILVSERKPADLSLVTDW